MLCLLYLILQNYYINNVTKRLIDYIDVSVQ